ncbi:MAG: hypothetical protein R2702_11290 [Acidimicrobiales bacterium]
MVGCESSQRRMSPSLSDPTSWPAPFTQKTIRWRFAEIFSSATVSGSSSSTT